MRHPGHPSRAAAMVPIVPVDCRLGRPVPPPDLSDRERALWQRLALSRRPNWFSGSERVLADYVTAAIACEDLQAQLRKARPGTSDHYMKLLRLYRQTGQFAAMLATKLRLVPLSKTDKHLPNDGDQPLPNMGFFEQQPARMADDVFCDAATGERSFEALRRHMAAQSAARGANDANLTEPDSAASSEGKTISHSDEGAEQ